MRRLFELNEAPPRWLGQPDSLLGIELAGRPRYPDGPALRWATGFGPLLPGACPAAQKLVLLRLADHASDSGEAWPAQSTIAEATGLSERTVGTSVAALEEIGVLTRLAPG